MASKDVTPLQDVNVVDPVTGELATVKGWAAVVPRADPDAYIDQIVAEYLAAETVDDLLVEPKGTEGLRDYVGKVVTIHDARWSPSSHKKGPGCFYTVDITVADSAEHFVVTTGATNVVAVIAKAYAAGWLPLTARVVEVASASNPENKIQYLVRFDGF
jgi:hypothetical protein